MLKILYFIAMTCVIAEAARAGQIYGSVTEGGRGVAGAAVEIECAGAVARVATARDGSYRVNVAQQGRCTLTLTVERQRGSVGVFSYPNPSQYDFEVLRRPDGSLGLKRR